MNVNLFELGKQFFENSKEFFLEKLNSAAEEKFNQAKEELLKEVYNHPISQELDINSGVGGSNSQFLNGRGTLFSFIGFPEGYNPIQALIKFLEERIVFVPADSIKGGVKSVVTKNCTARVPSKGDFVTALPIFWEPGRSWVYAIEEGISGLGHYLFVYSSASRSGKGIESRYLVNDISFRPVEYITPIFERFKNKLNARTD